VQTGLSKLTEKAVARWKINPIWFAMMAASHPRWSVSDASLVSVRAKGLFKGSKTSEGKSLTDELRQVRQGDVVKMVCNGNLVWLRLQKGDSFLITIMNVVEYHSWENMLADSMLENLLPKHVLSRGQQKEFNQQNGLELYQGIFHWPLVNGQYGAMRFDVRPNRNTMSSVKM
jgi:ASC-1-like (ASCH) protein